MSPKNILSEDALLNILDDLNASKKDIEKKNMELEATSKELRAINKKNLKLQEELEIKIAERTEELNEKVQKLDKTQKSSLYMIEDLNEIQTELRLQSEIASNLSEGIYLIRMSDGIIVYTNPKFEEMFGYALGEMVGKNVSIVNAPTDKDPEETVNEIMEILNKTGEWHGEVNNVKKDGTLFWCYANVSLFDHPKYGQVLISVHTDITDRKRADEALKAANKELEAFSYSVSHDLRAPLRAIDGFSSAVLEDYSPRLDSEGQRYLNIISDNAKKMGELIDDLLAFSRLGRKEMTKSDIDMSKLAKTVFEELKSTTPDRKLRLKVKDIPPASGDKAMINQVFSNLLSNAIKFTGLKDTAIIEVGSNGEGDQNVYYVKDNGAGFDMKYVDKLFGVFQRLHSAEEFEGTGVGLALVKRIINRHSGKVWAEGEVNKGATFYFTIPQKRGGEKT